jgi:hypothetical protein
VKKPVQPKDRKHQPQQIAPRVVNIADGRSGRVVTRAARVKYKTPLLGASLAIHVRIAPSPPISWSQPNRAYRHQATGQSPKIAKIAPFSCACLLHKLWRLVNRPFDEISFPYHIHQRWCAMATEPSPQPSYAPPADEGNIRTENAVNPLWAAASFVVDVVGRAGRIVAGVNREQWWRRRESNYSALLIIGKLLILQSAQIAKIA